MSDKFVMSFVSTCMAEGLTKEATAELLQRQSVVHAADGSAEWMEGYEKVARCVPGKLLPMVRSGYFEKSAGPSGQLIRAGLGSVWQGLKTGIPAMLSRPGVRRGVGVGAAAVATGYGVNELGHKVWGADPEYSVPTMSPGGYSAAGDNAAYEAELASKGVGIAAHNKQYLGADNGLRRKELEAGVARRDAGAGMAQQELFDMDKQDRRGTESRKAFFNDTNASQSSAKQRLAEIEEHRATMESHKTSPWYAPYRTYLRATGQNPEDVYNKSIADDTGRAGGVTRDLKVMDEDKRRMSVGWTGSNPTAPRNDDQLQQTFFQSYNK